MELSEYDILEAAKLYGFSEKCTIKLIKVSENANYYVEEYGRKAVIRLCRKGYRTLSELESEIKWLKEIKYLTPVADAIRGKNGRYIQILKNGGFSAAFKFIEGKNPDFDCDTYNLYKNIGYITAKLHSSAEKRKGIKLDRVILNYSNTIGKNSFWGDWRNGVPEYGIDIIFKACQKIKQRIGNNKTNFIIHSDIRPDNIIENKGVLTLIDFDDCGYGYTMYDMAASLSFYETHNNILKAIYGWIDGYEKIRKLHKSDLCEMGTFITLRRIQLTAWLYSRNYSTTQNEFGKGTVDIAEKYLKGHNFMK